MSFKTNAKLLKFLGFSLACISGLYVLLGVNSTADSKQAPKSLRGEIIDARASIAGLISPKIKDNAFPVSLHGEFDGSKQDYKINYTLDTKLQEAAEKILGQYRPDYGAIFMMDAVSGEVLAMASYQRNPDEDGNLGNLNLQSSFPSASIFKVVTATAAVDRGNIDPDDVIRYNGRPHTLYKKNVLSDKVTRWTNSVTLKEAFARSINTAFGRLSLEHLSPKDLHEYAERFMFNKAIHSDFQVSPGITKVPDEKGFELAEVASGFTRNNRMSPVQGAMIAAAIVNDGKAVVPHLVREIKDEEGHSVYQGKTLHEGIVMTPESAAKVRSLMEQTVVAGTSRRSFRPIVRDRKFNAIEMGGKTGNLTGDQPAGKTDWFVGYAQNDEHKIAIAAITVNKKFWTVKSSYLSQHMFRRYFTNAFADAKIKGQKTIALDSGDNN